MRKQLFRCYVVNLSVYPASPFCLFWGSFANTTLHKNLPVFSGVNTTPSTRLCSPWLSGVYLRDRRQTITSDRTLPLLLIPLPPLPLRLSLFLPPRSRPDSCLSPPYRVTVLDPPSTATIDCTLFLTVGICVAT